MMAAIPTGQVASDDASNTTLNAVAGPSMAPVQEQQQSTSGPESEGQAEEEQSRFVHLL